MQHIFKKSPALVDNCFQYKPIVIMVNSFNEAAYKNFKADFNFALQTGQDIIPIIIDSYGGEIYSLKGMMSIIKSSPVPVATYTETKSMSCGSFLLGFGHKGYRFASPDSSVMIHEVSSGRSGKVGEISASVEQTKTLNNELFKQLSIHCGKPYNFFHERIHDKSHADWYLNPEEMKQVGLIDYIGVPKFTTTVSVKSTIELI